jgi:uncharacterized protein YdhG (YjbR/CyaY superfamily)
MMRRRPGRHRRRRGAGGEESPAPESAAAPVPPGAGGESAAETETEGETQTEGERQGSVLMDQAVRDYIDAIPAEFRPLFDRFHGLVLRARPDAAVVLSYQMPSYKAGGRQLYLGVWKHGISVYGWRHGEDDGFVDRHAELKASTGTIRLRPDEAAAIPDDELLGFFQASLGSPLA